MGRCADDFLILILVLVLFQYENEARSVMDALKKRKTKLSLEVAEDKARIVPTGRFKGTKEEFDFPGLAFYNTRIRLEEIPRGNPHKQKSRNRKIF